MILLRIIDSQIHFDRVAAHPLHCLRGLDQHRICRKLIQSSERLRSDSHVVFVHLGVGENST